MVDSRYDVAILGGGLAGLTLGLQISRRCPDCRIVVIERRAHPAPEAAWKVGESTVELGTWYLREVLGLGEYLDHNHLPKMGLRFFLSARDHAGRIEDRIEVGPVDFPPVPSHQLDRGRFESDLAVRLKSEGIDFADRAKVTGVELSGASDLHRVTVQRGETEHVVQARWVVDAGGRAAILKRNLKLAETVEHDVNAVWFRMRGDIDPDAWSDDPAWSARLVNGERRLSTNHLMGKGYWVWLIPLASKSTSVGIVADPEFHPSSEFDSFEKALKWLDRHEPLVAREVTARRQDLQDFHLLRHYSHHCTGMVSAERWALTGDAGSFLDPLYSPGTDFIALANGFITELVARDLDGRPMGSLAEKYSRIYREMFDTWLPVFRNQYRVMGNDRVMTAKILWDHAVYWGLLVPAYVNDAYTSLATMARLRGQWAQFRELQHSMQQTFFDLAELDLPAPPRFVDPMALPLLRRLHTHMTQRFPADEFVTRFTTNLKTLEDYGNRVESELKADRHIRVSATRTGGTDPDDFAVA